MEMRANKTAYSPVALFAYNRPDHLRRTYTALARCPEAADTVLHIFCDGAKSDGDRAAAEKVRAAARSYAERDDFCRVILHESETNRGLAASVIAGVTQIMDACGSVIVLEDDCVVSPHFLRYMNTCLSYYEGDKTVGSISGYSPALDVLDAWPHDVFTAYRSCSWSWASWRDRWTDVDWELAGFSDFCRSRAMVRRFNAEGNDRFLRLYRQAVRGGSSWSVRFGMHLVKRGMRTVYPRFSYITNIGCDNSGVHSAESDAALMEVDIGKAIPEPTPEELPIDKTIQRAMKRHYSGGLLHSIGHELATELLRDVVLTAGVRHG